MTFSRIRYNVNSVRVYLIACIRCIRSNFNTVNVYSNAGNRCLFNVIFIFSGIRSHLVPFNSNTRNRCSFNVIRIFSGIRSHFFPFIGGQQLNYACICRFNVILIFLGIRSRFFPFTGGQKLNYARICCFVSVISNLSRIEPHLKSVDAYLNARILCFFNVFSNFNVIPIFSGIRSHSFPFTGGQQLNYACICCFVSVISNLSRIRPHLNSVDAYLNARISCFF